ncbi:DoxX family protein [Candidatus Woesearchaeota archaeon]|nr:DoxX family protein [Candidatus Woesearchaeota archaeon]
MIKKIKLFLEDNKKYSVTIIRIGIALVLLWFGIHQLINPESFLSYVPEALYQHPTEMMHEHSLQMMHNIEKPSVHFLVMGNGVFETIAGLFLLLGFYTRIIAFVTFLHLFLIALSLGYNDLMIRDLGLSIMLLSLVFSGAGKFSLDNKKK